MRPGLALTLSLLALARAGASAAPTPRPPEPPLVVPSGAERVLVDLVVRDPRGDLVRDLRADEVEVREDGVVQRVESLELVDRRRAVEPGSTPAFLAIVFERLGPGARLFARDAALRLLSSDAAAGTEVGVFSIDRGLAVVASFTQDRAALRSALAGGSPPSTTLAGERERELTRNAYHGLGEGFGQAHVAPAEQKGAPECRGREEVRIRLAELLESRLVEGFSSSEREQHGRGSARALMALVGALSVLPGRKAVLVFSEAGAAAADVDGTSRALVAAANRGRVSLYTADAQGLRVASPADEMRLEADALRTRLRASTDGGRLTDDSPLALLERSEDALRRSPEASLVRLADETGGFAIRGTNDLSAGLARLQEELGTHYVLSYTPTNRSYDGRFRAISVRVSRPHARLQARKGYLALATVLPAPVLPYEAPALAALESKEAPADVPVRLRGLQFPEEPSSSRVAIAVEVPTGSLASPEEARHRDLAIVLLVRERSGRVLHKLSERYAPGGGPARRGRGPVRFYREVRLAPGDYRLEAGAWDASARRAGRAEQDLVVPPGGDGRLRASSLVVVSRAEKGNADAREPPALQLDGVLLHPNLGETLEREAGRPLAFFLSAWPAAGRPAVDARVEVRRGERTVAEGPPLHLQAGADGRVQLVSSFPVESLPGGAYELRVTVTDGRDSETRTAALSVGR